MAQLTLALLGGFEARLAAQSPLVLPKKTQALLAYLALAPKPACPRSELETLLWGDTGRPQAQGNLRQTLAGLRRALGKTAAAVLHADAATVALDRKTVTVDAVRFEGLVAKDDADALAEAATLHGGALLAGLDIDEGPFEAWLTAQRERFRELATHALTRLLAHQSKGRALDDAVQTAARMLALDPLHEPAHRALMRLYVRQGRRPAGLRQYQTCLNVLRQELGVEPTPETKKVYEEILRGAAAAPVERTVVHAAQARADARETLTLTAAATPFVGRDAELAMLRTAMDQAFAGEARVVALQGAAGVGKSRLLAQAAAEAVQRGARVLVGRSYRTEQILPLGPWRDALRDAGVLEHPEMSDRLRVEDAPRVFDAIGALVEALAAGRPLAIVLEDLQWADDMTLRLVAFLARRQRARPLLLMVTITSEDLVDAPSLRELMAELSRERAVQRVVVEPLSREDTTALVRAVARADDEPALARLAEQVWALSEGNPFMVVETVQAVEEGSATATPSALPLSERVRDVVAARLDRVGEASRGVLAVAAVIGRDVDFGLLQRAAGVDEAAAAAALEELVRRGVLRVVGERFIFAHNHIREVIYRGLLPPRRKLLHRQTVAALRAQAAPALDASWAALGTHAYEGELWDEAAEYFRRAGQWALARSFNREAVGCFERAVASLDRASRDDATALAIDVRLELRSALVLVGDVEGARAPLEQARPLAESLGDRVRLGHVWAQGSSQYWWSGQPAAALEAAQTAARLAAETGDHSVLVVATICRGYAHFSLGDYREVVEVLEPFLARQAAAERDRYGQQQLPIVSPSNQVAAALAHLGDFEAAIACALANVARAEALDHRYALAHMYWGLGEIHVHRTNGVDALAPIERSLSFLPDRADFFLYANIMGALGYANVLIGRIDTGLAMMREVVGDARTPWRVGLSRLVARWSEALMIAGRLDEAREAAERCLALARGHGERGYEAWALRLLGELASRGTPSDAEPALTHFRDAMALAEPRGMLPVLAHGHFGIGRALGQRAEVDAAIAMYRTMGMARWLAEAEAARAQMG